MIPIPEDYHKIESCVYKLFYGDRYVIVKGKTLAGSIFVINKGYAAFVSIGGGKWRVHDKHKEWDGKNSYYFKFYTYIYKNPNFPFRVEILLESNNALELLKREQEELHKVTYHKTRDKKCLNNNVNAYIPKESKDGNYGWISKDDVSTFQKLLALV